MRPRRPHLSLSYLHMLRVCTLADGHLYPTLNQDHTIVMADHETMSPAPT